MIVQLLSRLMSLSDRFTKKAIFQKTSGAKSRKLAALCVTCVLVFSLALPLPFIGDGNVLPARVSPVAPVSAGSAYHNLSGGNLTLSITSSTTDMITTNDDWSNFPSVEGYFGRNLTNTHGISPQTVLNAEFTNSALPSAGDTQVNANKGNPSAFNSGGLTEFDAGTYLAIGMQGNVQANPYLLFYINTTGRSSITMSYDVIDIDTGSNNSVSPVALQYRIGSTGDFTNIADGFVADATDGPTVSGRITSKTVTLPSACDNQPQIQVRLITTNAANSTGGSTPDEWIGINNVTISGLSPSAGTATVSGRAFSPTGRALSGATVYMYDSMGNVRTSTTNLLGNYRFTEVGVGGTYVLEIRSKRYVFAQTTQVITVNEDLQEINFYAALLYKGLFESALSRKGE